MHALTQYLNAKSSPHPWTKSFCRNQKKKISFIQISCDKHRELSTARGNYFHLNQMPHALPRISWEDRCHYLHKAKIKQTMNINKKAFKQMQMQMEKKGVNNSVIIYLKKNPTQHMVGEGDHCIVLISLLILCNNKSTKHEAHRGICMENRECSYRN